ncbi:MAG: carboxypeptidase-like regulatory domain-containing protein [Actinomycetota bacterium]|nr:carboxypeptidase-like regulatory domain-containing protein [Actinomycetota bacterium]
MCIGVVVAVANPAVMASGRLTGKTQISFGCPGPVREGTPGCNPWRPFAHARFSLRQRSASGNPIPGTRRTVTSDAHGRFQLLLPAGAYVITPLPQQNTDGGKRLNVQVRAGESATVLVRFAGFPRME